MENECIQIRRCEKIPTPEEFTSQIELKNVPAVIVGCIKNWKAFTLWNPSNGGLDYLQVPLPFSTFIGICKELYQNKDSNLGACFNTEKDVQSDESGQRCLASEDDKQQVYLAQVPIMNTELEERVQLPTLSEDIKLPEFLEAKSLASINLWMNSARARSSTHYDPHHNVLCVVSGCKQVLLWPPSASPYLYPMPLHGEASNHSAVALGKVDLLVHPRAEGLATISQKVTIHAGDALFIPEGWFHQVDSDCLTIAVNFWWRSEVMLGMSEHMDAYYMRRIVKRLTDKEMNQVLCKASNAVGQTVTNTKDLSDRKTDNDVPNLNKDCLTKGTKAKKLIERTTLHELEPLAMQSLHALVSLVHDCVNIMDQSQSTEPSTSNVFAVGEKDANKFNLKDAYLLEDDPVASIIWKLQPLTLQSVLLAMAQNFPRTLEALVLHLLSPVGAEVLTRRLEEMDQSMDEEDRNQFYQIFYGVFDDQFAVMDALLNQKESFALQAFKNVLDKYMGIKFNGSTPWVG
ncbi:lysine-specific demethylase JMJ31 isoform X2 [Apium graveolens]|uniref:lysine-specific demethylase JMJ31 isoform X2 n=1 Tax=Apium graveolens TaxID=4045 RepID=UPI003D7C10E5